jgi:hypothetical protein
MKELAQTWTHWRYQYYLDVRWAEDCLWLSVQQKKGDTTQLPHWKHFGIRWEHPRCISVKARWPPEANHASADRSQGGQTLTPSQQIEHDPIEQLRTSLCERAAKIKAIQARFGPDMPEEFRIEILNTAQAVIDYWQDGGKHELCYKARWKFEHAPVNFSGPQCSRALGRAFFGLDADD